MGYSRKQARAKAEQIFNRFGDSINFACSNSIVAESFLAGFIGVEAGVTAQGLITEDATRFERGVYEDLISLRDNGFCFVAGKKRNTYSGVTQRQIADADDAAVRALATSYGLCQIMGWHVINNLKCTIADLRNPEKHLHYTVRLLTIVGGEYLRRGNLESVLRIWNTGSANGKTYHEDYVANALLVKSEYEKILSENKKQFKREYLKNSAAVVPSHSPMNQQQNAGNVNNLPQSEPSPNPSTQTTIKTETVEIAAAASANTTKPAENFAAFIPQIDTAKSWLKRIFSGSVLATAAAVLGGFPLWLQIGLGVGILTIIIGGIAIFARYHKEIFAYVTAMNTLRATNGVDNPILTTEKDD